MAGEKNKKNYTCEPIFDDQEKKEAFLKENSSGRVTFDNGRRNCPFYVPADPDKKDRGDGFCVAAEMRCRLAYHSVKELTS